MRYLRALYSTSVHARRANWPGPVFVAYFPFDPSMLAVTFCPDFPLYPYMLPPKDAIGEPSCLSVVPLMMPDSGAPAVGAVLPWDPDDAPEDPPPLDESSPQ